MPPQLHGSPPNLSLVEFVLQGMHATTRVTRAAWPALWARRRAIGAVLVTQTWGSRCGLRVSECFNQHINSHDAYYVYAPAHAHVLQTPCVSLAFSDRTSEVTKACFRERLLPTECHNKLQGDVIVCIRMGFGIRDCMRLEITLGGIYSFLFFEVALRRGFFARWPFPSGGC